METATKQKQQPAAANMAAELLPNRKVILLPVPRDGQMFTDPKHKGYFMFEGTKKRFVLPIDVRRNTLVPILTDAERKFFEELLGLDLNFFKPRDNFWHTFEVVVSKDDSFMESGLLLDLSNPMDNLRWRVLKVQPSVAPSWEDRYESGEYQFALRDAGYTEETRAKKAEVMQKAYRHFSKMDSASKMFEFLSIYWMDKAKAKRPPEGADIEVYTGLIQEIIDNDVHGFIELCEDSKADMKLLVLKAFKYGIIVKKSLAGDFETADGKYLGKTLEDTVTNLASAELNEYLVRITAHVKANE